MQKHWQATLTPKALLTSLIGSLDDLGVGGGVIGLDVGVDGLLHEVGTQLGLRQEAPHRWLVATFCKLIGAVQVVYMHDQHLQLYTELEQRATFTTTEHQRSSPSPKVRP